MNPFVKISPGIQHVSPGSLVTLRVEVHGGQPAQVRAALLFNANVLRLRSVSPAMHWSVSYDSATMTDGVIGLNFATRGSLAGAPLCELLFECIGGPGASSHVVLDLPQITDVAGRERQAGSVTARVIAQPLTLGISSTALPDASTAETYTASLPASGGVPPYSWAIPALPPGLSIRGSVVSGSLASAGPLQFEAQLSDNDDPPSTVSASLTLNVTAGALSIAGELEDAYVGEEYGGAFHCDGGVGPYTWQIESGTLPAGLAMQSDGTIAGVPSVVETQTISARVTDSQGSQAAADVKLATRVFSGRRKIGTCSDARTILAVPNAIVQPYDITIDLDFGSLNSLALEIAFDDQVLFRDGVSVGQPLVLSGMPLVGGPRAIRISQIVAMPARSTAHVRSITIATADSHDRGPATRTWWYGSHRGAGYNLSSPLVQYCTLPGSGDDLAILRDSAIEFVAIRPDGTAGRRFAYALDGVSSIALRSRGCGARSTLGALGGDASQYVELRQLSDGHWIGRTTPLKSRADAIAYQEPNLLAAHENAITQYAPDGSTTQIALPARSGNDPVAAIASLPQVDMPDGILALSRFAGRLDAVNFSSQEQSITIGRASRAMDWTFTEGEIFADAFLAIADYEHGRVVSFKPFVADPFTAGPSIDAPPSERVMLARIVPGGDQGVIACSRRAGIVAAAPTFLRNSCDFAATGKYMSETLRRNTRGQLAITVLDQNGGVLELQTRGVHPSVCYAVDGSASGPSEAGEYVETSARVIVGNQGGAPMTISSIRIDGDRHFVCRSRPQLPVRVNAGDAVAVEVAFTGEAAGTYGARLMIWTDDPVFPATIVPLTQTVAGSATVRTMPDNLNFEVNGGVTAGGPVQSRNWVIDVLALSGGTFESASIGGPDADLFTLQSVPAQGTPMHPWAPITIVCDPKRSGHLEALVTAAIIVAGQRHLVATPLRLYVNPAPQPGIDGARTVNFSAHPLGVTATATAYVRNSGFADLIIQSATISGPDNALFSVTTPLPLTLTFGQSTHIALELTGSSAGQKNATLTLHSNAGDFAITLYADVIAPSATVTPLAQNYGTMNAPDQRYATTIYNFGSVPVHVSAIGVTGAFSLASPAAPLTLGVGTSVPVQVNILQQPSGTGSVTGALTIQTDDPQNEHIVVTLTAAW